MKVFGRIGVAAHDEDCIDALKLGAFVVADGVPHHDLAGGLDRVAHDAWARVVVVLDDQRAHRGLFAIVLCVAVCPGELDKACRKGSCCNSIGLDACCRFGVQCCLIDVVSHEIGFANFEPEASRGGIDLDVELQTPGA